MGLIQWGNRCRGAATFNGPGNPVSLAAGLGGGGSIFAGASGGMFGGGGVGANGATGGRMFGGAGVAQMVTDRNTAPVYAGAPTELLVNNGINPKLDSTTLVESINFSRCFSQDSRQVRLQMKSSSNSKRRWGLIHIIHFYQHMTNKI